MLQFKPCGSESLYYRRNQQYSVVALTNASAAIIKRSAYTAYGVPTITNASGTLLPVGSVDNRYLYTGREWDQTLAMSYYRASMYDSPLGRFASRDPIGYFYGEYNLLQAMQADPLVRNDPYGLCAVCASGDIALKKGGCTEYTTTFEDGTTATGYGYVFEADVRFNQPCKCCGYRQYFNSESQVEYWDAKTKKLKQVIPIDKWKTNPLPPGVAGPAEPVYTEDCIDVPDPSAPGGSRKECYGRDRNSKRKDDMYANDGCSFHMEDQPGLEDLAILEQISKDIIVVYRLKAVFKLQVVDVCNGEKPVKTEWLHIDCQKAWLGKKK